MAFIVMCDGLHSNMLDFCTVLLLVNDFESYKMNLSGIKDTEQTGLICGHVSNLVALFRNSVTGFSRCL